MDANGWLMWMMRQAPGEKTRYQSTNEFVALRRTFSRRGATRGSMGASQIEFQTRQMDRQAFRRLTNNIEARRSPLPRGEVESRNRTAGCV